MISFIETNPITYKFTINVTVQTIEKDGELYLDNLMRYFYSCGFKIINGSWSRKHVSHNRLGDNCNADVVIAKINLEKETCATHNPEEYIDKHLSNNIHNIFSVFRKYLGNDDALDYINWINYNYTSYIEEDIKNENKY